ncbi:hypothetical protein TNCV_2754871 [Trichonephila clavipes]|nr:hypothetical protein TNCV_2754871 [Trichonephila clavipes]
MASPLPRFAPVQHVWDQLKRQMPSCHSVHDLELAVQDLWAHLPQESSTRANDARAHKFGLVFRGRHPPLQISPPCLYWDFDH